MVKSYYRWDHELLISALICGILTYIENASLRKERFGMGENMELGELRKELDGIDSQLADLYEKRMDICSQVADYKIKTSKSVYDPEREAQKIEAIGNLAHNEFNRKGLEELLEQIMSASRKLQYKKMTDAGAGEEFDFCEVSEIDTKNVKVVFQGADGAYSQMAMCKYFGDDVNCIHVDTFRGAMETIKSGKADYAVLPIENSTAGSVSQTEDLLEEYDCYIVAEQVISINHCLMGIQGADITEIKKVFSHPQSLMQSAKFLSEHPEWETIGMQNNAFAAQKVKNDGDRTQAAIASEKAANLYDLDILKRGINQEDNNETRFIIVTNKKMFRSDASKIIICLELPHKSGTLYRILSHFIYNDLNMTKIESRPLEGRNWEYRFFVDFTGNLNDSAVKSALLGIREESGKMKILGCY